MKKRRSDALLKGFIEWVIDRFAAQYTKRNLYYAFLSAIDGAVSLTDHGWLAHRPFLCIIFWNSFRPTAWLRIGFVIRWEIEHVEDNTLGQL